ncbi:MAG: hypothetical protein NTY98_22385 [Verrucomicrobia bacterium]|nr:hypothetical protein [Verrucomicrobiota bacterium]
MNPNYLVIGAIIIVVFVFLVRRGGIGGTSIQSPRLGFLNLKGAAGNHMLAEDRSAIAPLFSAVLESSTTPPLSDVLFIYCDIGTDGRISGTSGGLRDLIRDSGARVVVVASENPSEGCIATAKNSDYGHANLVLTLNRRGAVFPAFFSRLFSLMMIGTSMPMAWVKLAPQIPGLDHADCPGTIFLAEAGQISFK